ncbi:hypothetical protein F52700_3812 [Fusarium sp. NRRL 52700]|nr:hypothetical protein F52700_3812 [Fusarium sp. NRRL 52700]
MKVFQRLLSNPHCANSYGSISSDLLPQISSSAGLPNKGNSQRTVEDEIQALVEHIDNSICEWRLDDGTNQAIGTENIINVPNAPAILDEQNTEVDALFCGTRPTTPWNNKEEGDSNGYTSGESFGTDCTGGSSYQPTGQNGANLPTRSRSIVLIKAILIDERLFPLTWPQQTSSARATNKRS